MTTTDIIGLIGLILTALTFFAYAVRKTTRLEYVVETLQKFYDELKRNQETIIDFLMQRAKNAGKLQGLFMENSPLKLLKPEIRKLYEPIINDLHKLYNTLGIQVIESQLWLEVQSQFGEWISNNICLKVEPVMTLGECITTAMILAQESETSINNEI